MEKTQNLTHDQLMERCNEMVVFGGSFAASLAKAMINADANNRLKLMEAFPEFFKRKSA